jgi:hypothetical protein
VLAAPAWRWWCHDFWQYGVFLPVSSFAIPSEETGFALVVFSFYIRHIDLMGFNMVRWNNLLNLQHVE